ncbi:competence protein CoiA family protein [Bacillus sp. FJAT-50079]|uniref:competence protein CoiA n=1 Tax=Bacillus sp. FJAT-50079 TaxID=2833577 RepID=UPI001BCA33B3|nr:competence protein CoiA family protein [Bacillus sp. FJAT-50079]MBS4207958.1 hypothetical protein [Bacillus sp. FJAT-50079]
MLTAINEKGKFVSLVRKLSEAELQDWRCNHTFYCPECKEQLTIKAGTVRIMHFSHKRNTNCVSMFEGESELHLEGKQDLYQFFHTQGIEVYLEYYLTNRKQRPDLYVKHEGRRFAIEYQCSSIPSEQLARRSLGYENERITPLWIYGGVPYQKQLNSHTFQLSEFHFALAKQRAQKNLSILSYSPKTKRIYLLHGIIPLTTRKVHATLYSHRLFTSTIPQQISIIPRKLNPIKWKQEKNKWLSAKVRSSNLARESFIKSVYTANDNPYMLPIICGLPCYMMECFHSHPLEWQYYIYQDCLKNLIIGQKISLKYVFQKMKMRIRNGFLFVRTFPLQQYNSWEEAVIQYFLQLVKLEYFSRIGEDLFQKLKHIQTASSYEEAIKQEYAFYEQWQMPFQPERIVNECIFFSKQELLLK